VSLRHRVDREYVRLRLRGSCEEVGARSAWSGPETSPLGTGARRGAGPSVPAAVLVGLLDEGEGPHVILTRRTTEVSDHPGEVSLPGGRKEPLEEAPEETALREAEEEVGIPRARVEVLGCLPLYRTVSDYCVRPVVGWVEPPVAFKPDPREVAEVFLVPLGFILEPANRRQGSLVRDGVRRTYYELEYEGRRIWGATAAILLSLARALESG